MDALAQMTEATATANGPQTPATFVGTDVHAGTGIAGADMLLAVVITLGTTFILFVLWKIVRIPVTRRPTATYYFWCPVSRRAVRAQFQVDATESKFVEVNWCSAFQPAAVVRCTKRCIREQHAPVSSHRLMDLNAFVIGLRIE